MGYFMFFFSFPRPQNLVCILHSPQVTSHDSTAQGITCNQYLGGSMDPEQGEIGRGSSGPTGCQGKRKISELEPTENIQCGVTFGWEDGKRENRESIRAKWKLPSSINSKDDLQIADRHMKRSSHPLIAKHRTSPLRDQNQLRARQPPDRQATARTGEDAVERWPGSTVGRNVEGSGTPGRHFTSQDQGLEALLK